jgi:hypothetical protein
MNQPSCSRDGSAPNVMKQRFATATRLMVFSILMQATGAVAVFSIWDQLIFGVLVIMTMMVLVVANTVGRAKS